MPTEFFMHLKAAKCDGVVKVSSYLDLSLIKKSGTRLVRATNKLCYGHGKASQLNRSVRIFSKIRRNRWRTGQDNHPTGKSFWFFSFPNQTAQIVQNCIDLRQKSKVLHRDLKDENILINTADLSVKIIDFGCACEYKSSYSYATVAGTPEFFPPEIVRTQNYSADALNAWSIGILVYILVQGDVPFDNDKMILKLKRTKVSKRIFQVYFAKNHFQYSEGNLSSQCVDLLNGCLTSEGMRLSTHEILNCEWLKVTEWDLFFTVHTV